MKQISPVPSESGDVAAKKQVRIQGDVCFSDEDSFGSSAPSPRGSSSGQFLDINSGVTRDSLIEELRALRSEVRGLPHSIVKCLRAESVPLPPAAPLSPAGPPPTATSPTWSPSSSQLSATGAMPRRSSFSNIMEKMPKLQMPMPNLRRKSVHAKAQPQADMGHAGSEKSLHSLEEQQSEFRGAHPSSSSGSLGSADSCDSKRQDSKSNDMVPTSSGSSLTVPGQGSSFGPSPWQEAASLKHTSLKNSLIRTENPATDDKARDTIQSRASRLSIVSMKTVAVPKDGGHVRAGVQKRCHNLVDSPAFDYITAGMVFVNAATIGMQTDAMAQDLLVLPSLEYRLLETAFCIAFLVELLMRIFANGMSFFFGAEWKWNMFDAALVSLQVSDELVTRLALSTGGDFANFSFMRILRILRLIRIMRIIRILRLIGELRAIVASIMGSMKSLMWTVVLLFLFVYIFAVYLTQAVLDHRVENLQQLTGEHDIALAYYFGSLGRSVFSLYQAITGGSDWDQLANPLMEQLGTFFGFLLAAFTAFALLALMNVVTGVFVEAALETAKKDRSAYMLRHTKELFSAADPENTGVLDWDRFQASLGQQFMQEFFDSIEVDLSEARSVFALLDNDESGEIDLDEFLNGCLGLHGPAQALHLATLMYESRINFSYISSYLECLVQILQNIVSFIPNMDQTMAPAPVLSEEAKVRQSYRKSASRQVSPDQSEHLAFLNRNSRLSNMSCDSMDSTQFSSFVGSDSTHSEAMGPRQSVESVVSLSSAAGTGSKSQNWLDGAARVMPVSLARVMSNQISEPSSSRTLPGAPID